MTDLPLVLSRAALLPSLAVTLRLGDVIPRHDRPPSLAGPALLIPAASVTVPDSHTGDSHCSNPTS